MTTLTTLEAVELLRTRLQEIFDNGALLGDDIQDTLDVLAATINVKSPATPAATSEPVAEGVDTAELRADLKRIWSAANGPSFHGFSDQLIVKLDGLLAQQREAGRRDERAKVEGMRSAFHRNMLRAFPEKSHEEISAEIDKAAGVISLPAIGILPA